MTSAKLVNSEAKIIRKKFTAEIDLTDMSDDAISRIAKDLTATGWDFCKDISNIMLGNSHGN